MKNLQACISDINHTCDGPVTQFVAISRAISLKGEYADETIAEALNVVINDISSNGPIPSDEGICHDFVTPNGYRFTIDPY